MAIVSGRLHLRTFFDFCRYLLVHNGLVFRHVAPSDGTNKTEMEEHKILEGFD